MAENPTSKPRAREALGVNIGPLLKPGPLNAITDVPHLRVGMSENISGGLDQKDGPLTRVGVTSIGTLDIRTQPLFAGIEAFSGSGEMTGSHLIVEGGQLRSFVFITGTQTVGAVHSDATKYDIKNTPPGGLPTLPCVAETWDRLTDPDVSAIAGDNVNKALDEMLAGPDHKPVREGNVGGGAPMCSFGLKGGTGTSSRVVPNSDGGTFTVGVLVQANHGTSIDLTIDGVNVGRKLYEEGYTKPYYPSGEAELPPRAKDGDGSIIAIIATDAPLLPHQCKALARRAGVGISRGGGGVAIFSGDIFLAFSTATSLTEPKPPQYTTFLEPVSTYTIQATSIETMDVLFRAAADATEEAILNALCAAEEMVGFSGRAYKALPVKRVREILQAAR